MIRLALLLFCTLVGALLYYANRDIMVTVRFLESETAPLSMSLVLLYAVGVGFVIGLSVLLPGLVSARVRLMMHRRNQSKAAKDMVELIHPNDPEDHQP
ncbi:MAG: LapA family protein [Nitrospirota bacterium]|nr:LapA family protein [Nitrospirota bacterium]